MHRFHSAVLLSVLLIASACATAPPPSPTAVATPPPAGVHPEMDDALHWARNSAEHEATFLQTFRLAGEIVAAMAEEHEPGTWAVITDADETIIDNSGYQVMLEERGIDGFDRELWGEWVESRAATALPGARDFLDKVHDLGGFVAVVTNRREPLCPATADTLEARKLDFDVLLCQAVDGDGDKSGRWESVEEGTASVDMPPVRVLMYLGDNIHDFPGMEQEDRFGPASNFERFGTSFLVLPNPMYGSWTDNPKR